jgi:hypothetical protein
MRVRYNKNMFFVVPRKAESLYRTDVFSRASRGSWRRNVNDGGVEKVNYGLESKLKGNNAK